MRTRDEVLREWSYSSESECTWLELKLIDRLRELEAQQALPPIREKFVRVSDELVAELKAAPSKPVTVAIVEDGNELHMTFREAPQAASEPVAWALCSVDGKAILADTETDYLEKVRFQFDRDDAADAPHSLRPLVFGDVAHPSAAAVTEAMVEAAARAFYGAFYDGDRLWVRCPDDIRVWWMDAGRDALTAALTHPTTPTRGSDE